MCIRDRVVDGSVEELDEAGQERIRTGLERALASSYYARMVADLESRAEIERDPGSE